jgi:DNA-directed RNA polymerase subunit RPC12/RpoP
MNQFKFSCPQCQQHLQCDEQFAGREIQCPGCNHLIRIPPVPGQTAQYSPESGKTWATFVPPGNAAPSKKFSVPPKKDNPKPPPA